MKVKSYKDLIVWQKAMDLVVVVYRTTGKFPKDELYGLISQIRRAVVSIPSNITEGQARHSTAEFRHFLSIARGSIALDISLTRNYNPSWSYMWKSAK